MHITSVSKRNKNFIIIGLAITAVLCLILVSCEALKADLKKLKGDLIGNEFTYYEYDSFGNHVMTASGYHVNMEGVPVRERVYTDDGDLTWSYSLSSVVNITIDGYQHVACGSSIIFEEAGLHQVDVELPDTVGTVNTGFSTYSAVASWVNSIRNEIGASKVIVVKSELGYPLAIYQGDSVHWEVASDLPKTTRISIDGYALYIHRVEFDVIDVELLSKGGK